MKLCLYSLFWKTAPNAQIPQTTTCVSCIENCRECTALRRKLARAWLVTLDSGLFWKPWEFWWLRQQHLFCLACSLGFSENYGKNLRVLSSFLRKLCRNLQSCPLIVQKALAWSCEPTIACVLKISQKLFFDNKLVLRSVTKSNFPSKNAVYTMRIA